MRTSGRTAAGGLVALTALLVSASAHAQGAPAPAPTYTPPQYVPNTTAPYAGPGAAPPTAAPPGAVPAGGPSSLPQAKGRELQRPQTIEEFKELRRQLREDLRDARDDDRDADVRRIRQDMEDVDAWYDEDTEKRSGGAMAGGIVMISVGGVSVVVGAFTLLIASLANSFGGGGDNGETAGAVLVLGGLGMVGGGIPLLIYGSNRVMVSDNALALPPAPRGEVVIGPGSFGLRGSF